MKIMIYVEGRTVNVVRTDREVRELVEMIQPSHTIAKRKAWDLATLLGLRQTAVFTWEN